jgi:SAM-dependent methyltransferase
MVRNDDPCGLLCYDGIVYDVKNTEGRKEFEGLIKGIELKDDSVAAVVSAVKDLGGTPSMPIDEFRRYARILTSYLKSSSKTGLKRALDRNKLFIIPALDKDGKIEYHVRDVTAVEGTQKGGMHPCCASLYEHVKKYRPTFLLDIGCGDGRDINYLLDNDLIKFAVGVDDLHTPKIYGSFNARTDGRAAFIQGEILPFLTMLPDEAFPYIISNNSFEHLSEPNEVLSECSRCLSAGGYLFLTLPEGRNHWDPDHKFAYSKKELTSIVSKHLNVLECEPLGGGNMYIFAQKTCG